MDNSLKKRKTFACFDNIKFLMIICVVIGHAIDMFIETEPTARYAISNLRMQGLFLFIYCFHMPLFIFISGLFDKKGRDKPPIRQAVSYIIIGYFLKMLISLINLLCTGKTTFTLLQQDGLFWFMFVLAYLRILCWLIRKADPRLVLLFSVLMALFIGYDNKLGTFLYLNRLIAFFPYYYLGYILEPQQIIDFCKKTYIKILSIIVILVWGYFSFFQTEKLYWMRKLFTGTNSYSKVLLPDCQLWHKALTMVITIALCIAIISLVPNIKIPVITKFGRRTLSVYFWHKAVIVPLSYTAFSAFIMDKYPNDYWLIWVAISIAVSFLFSLKPFSIPLESIINTIGKTKTDSKKE